MSEYEDDMNDFRSREEGKSGFFDKFIPDTLKKVFMLGAGTIFMTEEALRSLGSELRLPRDAADYLASQAAKSKKATRTTWK